jgi:hypothetical protein
MFDQHKKMVVAGVIALALTWWVATAPESPLRPTPTRPERPVLRFIAKVASVAARFGLTALLFAEPAPQDPDEVHLAHAVLGPDGHQQLRNEVW